MITNEAEIRLLLGLAETISEEERAIVATLHGMAEGAIKRFLKYDPVHGDRTEYYPRARAGEPQASEGTWESNGQRAWLSSNAITNELQLARLPVRSITTVHVDENGKYGQIAGAFAASTLLTAGQDYWLDLEQDGLCSSGLLHGASGWPVTPGSVKVRYTAGYTATEFAGRSTEGIDASPIKMATLMTVCEAIRAFMVAKKNNRTGWTAGRLQSESLGEYSYALDTAAASAVSAMQIAVPPSAQQHLQPFVHYGDLLL